jgi:hypothetical protein
VRVHRCCLYVGLAPIRDEVCVSEFGYVTCINRVSSFCVWRSSSGSHTRCHTFVATRITVLHALHQYCIRRSAHTVCKDAYRFVFAVFAVCALMWAHEVRIKLSRGNWILASYVLLDVAPRLRAAAGAAGAAAVPQQRLLGLHRRHAAAAARTGAGVLPASQPARGAQRSAGQVGV